MPDAAPFPRSIAIAGAWGYIGRKFLDVALARGLRTFVYDPGPAPADVDLAKLTRVADEAEFHRLDVDLFHLAIHPRHRRFDLLPMSDPATVVLCEKPMAEPRRPEQCRAVLDLVARSQAVVLYDFPELFDSLTVRLFDFLRRFRDVRITSVYVQRSKDREDPANARNRKVMVPIQYQESVHCLAFVLNLLGFVRGDVDAVLAEEARFSGRSEPYVPPNPEDYPETVDGRCRFEASFGDVRVEGLTDFKGGAEWAKRRVVRGIGDGVAFEIDLSYLEGEKRFLIDGRPQTCDPRANSYEQVLATLARWRRDVPRERLMNGLYPNPKFAAATYRLSTSLWEACH